MRTNSKIWTPPSKPGSHTWRAYSSQSSRDARRLHRCPRPEKWGCTPVPSENGGGGAINQPPPSFTIGGEGATVPQPPIRLQTTNGNRPTQSQVKHGAHPSALSVNLARRVGPGPDGPSGAAPSATLRPRCCRCRARKRAEARRPGAHSPPDQGTAPQCGSLPTGLLTGDSLPALNSDSSPGSPAHVTPPPTASRTRSIYHGWPRFRFPLLAPASPGRSVFRHHASI